MHWTNPIVSATWRGEATAQGEEEDLSQIPLKAASKMEEESIRTHSFFKLRFPLSLQ